jgi:hypothetical protein
MGETSYGKCRNRLVKWEFSKNLNTCLTGDMDDNLNLILDIVCNVLLPLYSPFQYKKQNSPIIS